MPVGVFFVKGSYVHCKNKAARNRHTHCDFGRVLMQDFLQKFAAMTCFTTVNEPLLDVCNNALSLESYLCS